MPPYPCHERGDYKSAREAARRRRQAATTAALRARVTELEARAPASHAETRCIVRSVVTQLLCDLVPDIIRSVATQMRDQTAEAATAAEVVTLGDQIAGLVEAVNTLATRESSVERARPRTNATPPLVVGLSDGPGAFSGRGALSGRGAVARGRGGWCIRGPATAAVTRGVRNTNSDAASSGILPRSV